MLSKSKLFHVFVVFGAALLTVGSLAADEPPKEDLAGSSKAAPAIASGSVISWDAELKVFRAPDDHVAHRISEQLQTMLQDKPYFSSAKSAEKETLPNGVVRLRLGAEALNLVTLTRTENQRTVAACIHGTSATASPSDETSDPVKPRSLPSTEGWVDQ